MRERIRARFFPQMPGALLFFISPGQRLTVTGLEAPFGEAEISRACGDVQVSESQPGRWKPSIARAQTAAKAERRQWHLQQEATKAAVLRGSVDPQERDRARLILEKQVVEGRVRELKTIIAEAKSEAVTTGRYMDPRKYRALERELEDAKQKAQALQTLLGNLRTIKNRDSISRRATLERAFMDVAHEILDATTFDALRDRARDVLMDLEDETADLRAATSDP